MESITFNFDNFIKGFITSTATLDNMQVSNNVNIKTIAANIFENEDALFDITKINTTDDIEVVNIVINSCNTLKESINSINNTDNPKVKNVQTIFKRTVVLNARVYAELLELLCQAYYDDVDYALQTIQEFNSFLHTTCKANSADNDTLFDGVWKLYEIDKDRSINYFTLKSIQSIITHYNNVITNFIEHETKEEQKAGQEEQREEQKVNEDADTDSEKELLAKWRDAEWVNIDPTVSSLLKTLGTLYRSGIESMAQAGILMNNGPDKSPLICVKCNQTAEGELDGGISNKIDSGFRTDLKLISTIISILPHMTAMQGIDPTTGFPTLAALSTNEGVMYMAHLMFQSVNIPLSGVGHNKNSIKRWIKDTKNMSGDEWIKSNNRSNRTRINKYSDAEAWYKWVIENTLFRYFIEAGLKSDKPTATAVDTIDKICETFARKLKNVVVVAERQSKGKLLQSTELRIATDQMYDPVQLASSIARDLNTGNAKDITATARNTLNQVTAIRIVYDQAAANAATVFASEIAQSLIDGGNTPQWNKVLLGRTPNGEFLFWEDFMYGKQAADRAYAIYAGSGAGKGIMTLTLMAAAISDKKQLFYTDGKPDSGASIGALAWKDGKEMYMFDGQAQGGDAFPGYMEANPVTNGMRDPQETLKYTAAIPKGIFTSDAEVREFLGVCRYLRSMTLCADILTARGGKGMLKNSSIPEEDFQIWVFDEMTSMSGHERSIRQKFADYIAGKGYKFAITKKDNNGQACLVGFKPGKDYVEAITPGSETYDEGVAYIADWLNWLVPLRKKFADISVIGLRNAQANIFFIFQNAEWLSNERDGAITTIAAVVQMLQCRKLVGANGLAKACGHYGDGNTMRTEWASQISSGGWWAVSNASDIRQEGTKMTIFKPYSIWGFRKPGSVGHDERYLDYYCNLILNGRVSASEVLQSAWDFAENALQELAASKVINPTASLKDYIYNVEKFSLDGEVYDPSTLTNEEEPTKDFNNPSDMFNKNLFGEDKSVDTNSNVKENEDNVELTPIELEKKNDGLDDAREALARKRAEQEAELNDMLNGRNPLSEEELLDDADELDETPVDMSSSLKRLSDLADKSQTNKQSSELVDRLRNLANLSGDAQERAIKEMAEQIAAGGFDIHNDIPQVSAEEAERAGTSVAHDTAELFKRDKDGRRIIESSKVPDANKQTLSKDNYVDFPHPVLEDSFFQGNNVNKLEKAKANAWKTYINSIIKEFGGKNAILAFMLTDNEIIVNGKLIAHSFMENSYITSLSQIADVKWTLEQFHNLSVVKLSYDVLCTFYLQAEDEFENPATKRTDRTFEEYIFLDLCPKINKFSVDNVTVSRMAFIEARKANHRKQSVLYKKAKQTVDNRKGIADMKKGFIKNNAGKYHLSDTQSRYKARQPKYKGGIFGKALYKFLDKIAPDA